MRQLEGNPSQPHEGLLLSLPGHTAVPELWASSPWPPQCRGDVSLRLGPGQLWGSGGGQRHSHSLPMDPEEKVRLREASTIKPAPGRWQLRVLVLQCG